MDLLSSLLKTAEADEYSCNFKKHGIDPFTLKLLDHEDLEALGITERTKRNVILKNIANLQIPAESRKNTKIDESYTKLVLFQMSNQLHKHLANLSCAVMRNDVVVTDVRLGPSVKCLDECIDSLSEETRKMKMLLTKRKEHNSKVVILGLISALLVTSSFIYVKFVLK
ncbi:hypothetical protein HHI36_021591 [Cryptolaemus montrouzieri]|uniref:SAM domain-containing protein n=1 Tax=Cryptolaemus montrouzieri TaxID=559131 RepID=A0ABD2MX79_9CUCU